MDARELTTPFRAHLEHCQHLGLRAQLEECTDYVQHVDVLVSEFLESYYLVERLWDPASTARSEAGDGELVLEPFYDSLRFELVDASGLPLGEPIVCASGALSPLATDQHPAITRHGLDFVGLQDGEPRRIVLGATQASKGESAFVLLLRALNGLAELSPPLRMAQLATDVLRTGLPEDAQMALCLGLTETGDDADARALVELARDLAESFVAKSNEIPQLAGTLAGVSCVELDPDALSIGRLAVVWSL